MWFKMSYGKKMFYFFLLKNCGKCKNCTVSRVKCIYGKKCTKECVLREFEKCFLQKLPSFMIRKCQNIFKSREIRECLRSCTHIISWKKCWHHCTHHPVIHRHHHCVKKNY